MRGPHLDSGFSFMSRRRSDVRIAWLGPGEKCLCPREKYRLAGAALSCSAADVRACTPYQSAIGSGPARASRRTSWEDPNGLEDSEDCRSAGRHGNQHVRLRRAQVVRPETICPALAATPAASSRGRRPVPNFQTSIASRQLASRHHFEIFEALNFPASIAC